MINMFNEFLLFIAVTISIVVTDLENTANIRSTWIPVEFFDSLDNNSFAEFSELGIQRVYIDVWNNGKVYFKSQTMNNILPSGDGFGYDALSKFIPIATAYNIQVCAWFEYGLMTSYGAINNAFAQYAQSQKWLLGESNEFYWLNPNLLSVRQFLSGILSDAINGYNITGVQLDDHFACPSAFSLCSVELMDSVAAYMAHNIAHTNMNKELIVFSSSPAPMDYAYNNLNVNIINWMYYGYFDEYIPQLYYSSASAFEQQLQYTIQQINKYLNSTAANNVINNQLLTGIRVDGTSSSTSWSDVETMINYSVNEKIGVCIWYCNGILNTYPTQFKQLWG
eukprot:398509_1